MGLSVISIINWNVSGLNTDGMSLHRFNFCCNSGSHSSQGLRKMSSPAAADGAQLSISFVKVLTTVVKEVTRLPARTAPPSPVGRPTPACPETSFAMDTLTAEMGGTSLRSCAVCPLHVNPLSFDVEMGSASLRPGGVTTQQTALMAAMRTTVVSEMVQRQKKKKKRNQLHVLSIQSNSIVLCSSVFVHFRGCLSRVSKEILLPCEWNRAQIYKCLSQFFLWRNFTGSASLRGRVEDNRTRRTTLFLGCILLLMLLTSQQGAV